jgi:DNA polymerase III epsilon subunit-like protein
LPIPWRRKIHFGGRPKRVESGRASKRCCGRQIPCDAAVTIMAERLLYLDTETTGISAQANAIVEVAIVDDLGHALLNTLVNPGRPIPSEAAAIHGITDAMVRDAPALAELWPQIQGFAASAHVVIYNADFDRKFFPDRLASASRISCAMLEFARHYGEKDPYRGTYRWKNLEFAARHVRHRWTGAKHRALADALACRSVWQWIAQRSR